MTAEEDEELRDLIDVLRQPLQGRSVLVPLGSQAFLEGTLDPLGSYDSASKCLDASDAVEDGGVRAEERVMIKIHNQDGEGEELERILTRHQAKEFFEAERDALLRTKQRSQGVATETAAAPRKVLDNKKAPTSSSKGKTIVKPQSASTKPSALSTADYAAAIPHAPAFFEIREELDELGREVRAEAVDVSRQLALLESDATHDSTPAEAWKREPSSRPVGHSPGGNGVPTIDLDVTNDETHPSTDSPSKKVLSDADYDKLSARLDELAMLEEQAEHNKVVNTASRKGLQGGGWSTGFLNRSTKKKKEQQVQKSQSQNRRPASSNGPSTPDAQPIRLESEEQRSRVVSFDPQRNDVREIPRVGQRSARELKTPPPSSTTFENPGFNGGGTVVASVVRERVKSSSKKRSDATKLRTDVVDTASESAASPSSSSQTDHTPKRLSRFAQERLRQQQEQNQR